LAAHPCKLVEEAVYNRAIDYQQGMVIYCELHFLKYQKVRENVDIAPVHPEEEHIKVICNILCVVVLLLMTFIDGATEQLQD
jgi:hypothetical protein